MKYEITKGSEKDFEQAPEWATLKERNTSGDLFFSEGHSVGCRVQGITTEHDFTIDDGNNDFTHLTLIAERRPITEPVWDGEGLPPVGVECEVLFTSEGSVFERARILHVGDDGIVGRWLAGDSAGGLFDYMYIPHYYRPIRSPEDVARDEAIASICFEIGVRPENIVLQQTYDAIAAGKIPGVTLSGK